MRTLYTWFGSLWASYFPVLEKKPTKAGRKKAGRKHGGTSKVAYKYATAHLSTHKGKGSLTTTQLHAQFLEAHPSEAISYQQFGRIWREVHAAHSSGGDAAAQAVAREAPPVVPLEQRRRFTDIMLQALSKQPQLVSVIVSYDTAEVQVEFEDGTSRACHIAAACTAAGAYALLLLPPIRGDADHNYSGEDYVRLVLPWLLRHAPEGGDSAAAWQLAHRLADNAEVELPAQSATLAFILLQDGAPQHTAASSVAARRALGLVTVQMPCAYARDLNPVEDMWTFFRSALRGHQLSDEAQACDCALLAELQAVWDGAGLGPLAAAAVQHYPARLQEVREYSYGKLDHRMRYQAYAGLRAAVPAAGTRTRRARR